MTEIRWTDDMVKTLRRGPLKKAVKTLNLGGWFIAFFIVLGEPFASAVTGVMPAPRLEVKELYFRDGYFHQIVSPAFRLQLRGSWAAGITGDDGEYICSGGGVAPYRIRLEPVVFTPDDWTGDDCSELEPGGRYRATATWEWKAPDGMIQSVGYEFDFVYTPPRGD